MGIGMQALILGCGVVGKAFGTRLQHLGVVVVGTCTHARSAEAIEALSLKPLIFDGQPNSALLNAAQKADIILASIPPKDEGDLAFLMLEETLAISPKKWIGYLSTTGVYGDRAGGWAFEDDALTPLSQEAHRRVQAENQWRALGHKCASPVHIFRLPGIYGPGRSALDQVRAGTARRIDKPGQIFSRAHRDDIVSASLASLAKPNGGRTYNICDDFPCASGDVTAFACSLLNLPVPPLVAFEDAGLSEMGRRFYSECKRVSNARAKAELGWRPQFPSYKEGLRDCLARENS
jgi:nucleoside-diphosphate-sugar epimerase